MQPLPFAILWLGLWLVGLISVVVNYWLYPYSTQDWLVILAIGMAVSCLTAWGLTRLPVFNSKYQQYVRRTEALTAAGQLATSLIHEVRNPLTSVKGFLQLLEKKVVQPELQEYITIMSGELDRATELIGDFLQVARPREPLWEKVDLNAMVRDMVMLVEGQAFLRGVSLSQELSPELPWLWLDRSQVKQVVLNLLSNALAATPSGGRITVRSHWRNRQVWVQVEDTGSGMPPEMVARIGTPFLTTKENGTGLGLYICRQIMARHEGRMEVRSELGCGSTFSLVFPDNFKADPHATIGGTNSG
ncbi:MAG: hypothetical protein D9V47_11555 [Clostridia bacterium]|nr:MAG: hypothetical protein D9V47_11555 [Clostridia bacterium]